MPSISVRIPAELIRLVNAYRKTLGVRVSLSAAVESLVKIGLEQKANGQRKARKIQ